MLITELGLYVFDWEFGGYQSPGSADLFKFLMSSSEFEKNSINKTIELSLNLCSSVYSLSNQVSFVHLALFCVSHSLTCLTDLTGNSENWAYEARFSAMIDELVKYQDDE